MGKGKTGDNLSGVSVCLLLTVCFERGGAMGERGGAVRAE